MAAASRANENDGWIQMFPVCLEDDGMISFQGLESDSWKRSKKCSELQIFRNIENYILIVKLESPEKQKAAFEYMTIQDRNDESGIRFTIQSYKDTVPRCESVALIVSKDNKTYCLRTVKQANGEMQVMFQERNIPERISGERSEFIFFKIPFSEGDDKYFKFETTLEQGCFLAFERSENSHTRRLIMKRVQNKDEVDETTKFSHSSE
ncbi:interleukin-18-like isoform X2 [Paroedura picta]|uniref:interleukin-18-like isoform X2 n=1 Tax=Paroedura picta TaxID=143630 RepID=UPI004057C84E